MTAVTEYHCVDCGAAPDQFYGLDKNGRCFTCHRFLGSYEDEDDA